MKVCTDLLNAKWLCAKWLAQQVLGTRIHLVRRKSLTGSGCVCSQEADNAFEPELVLVFMSCWVCTLRTWKFKPT